MNFFRRIFHRHREVRTAPQTLVIEGCRTRLTPAPDDAELAAQALLESLAQNKGTQKAQKVFFSWTRRNRGNTQKDSGTEQMVNGKSSNGKCHDSVYYHRLAERIREDRAMEARQATRYVAYCEQTLEDSSKLKIQNSQLSELEQGLYQRLDTVEREGGELKRRWQHCLASVTVRLMGAINSEEQTDKPQYDTGDKSAPKGAEIPQIETNQAKDNSG